MLVRKVYLSIMVTILCMITLVTVTFAWVGFLNVSSFERFQINLEASELKEYGIEISLTGKDGTFGSTVDSVELKKIILLNAGYTEEQLDTQQKINYLFAGFNMDQTTVCPNDDKSFPDFTDRNNKPTKAYFKFDIYISPYRALETDSITTEYFLDAYLKGELLEGTKDTRNLVNEFTYPSDFINDVPNGILANTKIKKDICVDSASACRVSIQKYNVVEKYKPEQYDTDSIINDLIIYQGGTQEPTYEANKDVYSFGGILENKHNLAYFDYKTKFPDRVGDVPDWAINRGDQEYHATDENQIINSLKAEEKIGINQMMKMTICFWFEGWDADCFDVIDGNPVTLNLNFSTNNDRN